MPIICTCADRKERCMTTRRMSLRFAFILTVAVAAVGCGSSSSTSSSGSASSGTGVQTLSIGMNSPDPLYAAIWLADGKGYFKAHNLDVTFKVLGQNEATELAAGDVDAVIAGAPLGLTLQNSGKQVSYIAGLLGGGV